MRRTPRPFTTLIHFFILLAMCVPAAAQQRAPGRERTRGPGDPRVQMRTYLFTDTKEELPYALFVSSKVRPDRKSPLIVALHGLGGQPALLLRDPALKLAEEGGYIMVGPMGYNPTGWYGSPIVNLRGRRTPGPANLSELSEKDVMNVLEIVRKEFNVDENRIYVMGHSMGGAGAFHLAVKYPGTWAAIAAIAPAVFEMKASSLSAVPNMPMIVVQGDADPMVPVSMSREWVEFMKQRKMTHEYLEIAGGNHGSVIGAATQDIFKFFAEHPKTH